MEYSVNKLRGLTAQQWERTMKRHEVILKAIQGEITWIQAAEILGLSCRQMRRIKKSYEEKGTQGLLDHRIGSPAWNQVPSEVVQKVLKLYREEYFDFNVKHFHEQIQSEHGIQQSYPWTLYTLQNAGLVPKQNTREKHRKRRERRPLPGMMIHLDGSDHQWIGESLPKWDLLATLDDANNEVYHAFFAPEEDTRSVLSILRTTIEQQGVFCSLYTDRARHFIVTDKAGEKPDPSIRTQCQRALDQLGIRLIPAYSPQARGRGERLWRTFQGRLPQELRRAGVQSIDNANSYLLEKFIPHYNERFKVSPSQAGTAFVPVLAGQDLNRIFSLQYERIVTNDNTVSFKKRVLQLPQSSLRFSFARCKVTVYEHLDGSFSIGYGAHALGTYDSNGILIEIEDPLKALSKKSA
jgi:transposase